MDAQSQKGSSPLAYSRSVEIIVVPNKFYLICQPYCPSSALSGLPGEKKRRMSKFNFFELVQSLVSLQILTNSVVIVRNVAIHHLRATQGTWS